MKTKKYRILLPVFLILLVFLFTGGIFSPVKQTAHIPLLNEAQLREQTSLQLPVKSDIEDFKRMQSTDPSNYFIENKGQWAPEVKYLVRQGGMNAWITTTGIVYDFYRIERDETNSSLTDPAKQFDPANRLNPEENKDRITGHVVNMKLENARESAAYFPEDKSEAYYNYFIGNDQSKWASYVGLYGEVTAANVYSNIDARYYFDEEGMRYDFILNPGANVADIKMNFEGAYGTEVNAAGELVIYISLGEVTQRKLYAYQEINGSKEQVTCAFTKTETGAVTFTADWKDKTKPLVIDPLIYSTFLGGVDNSIAVGADGSAYVTGFTNSVNFPTTTGAYDVTYNGYDDAFITKLNPSGSALVYSTFLGGGSAEYGNSIALGTDGSAYVTGFTFSSDFPTTSGAFDVTYNGGLDAFITKLNPSGSALVYSTFLGGGSDENGYSIALGTDGSVYVTGITRSTDYPATAGAYDATPNGFWDAFITKLNPSGSTLVYSTYLGGSSDEYGYSIALGTDGNAFVTGYTVSTDFPATAGAFDVTYNGGSYDAFITKLNPAGSALVYSTFLGGSLIDESFSIVLGTDGSAYVTGETYSSDYPATAGAYDVTYNGGSNDAFITKLNPTGSALVYSTFLGGSDMMGIGDYGTSIALGTDGSVYVTGSTISSDFPTTIGAYDVFFNNAPMYDAFFTKLNPAGSALAYSTFLGGSDNDNGKSIALGTDGIAYVMGYTSSTDFPTTAGAYDINGGSAFITKFYLNAPATPTQSSPPTFGTNVDIPTVFDWSVYGASLYHLVVASNNTFTTVVYSDTTLTNSEKTLTDLEANTTYFWKVRGKNEIGWGEWTAPESFTTRYNNINGKVTYRNSANTPIQNYFLNINYGGSVTGTDTTNSSGNYLFGSLLTGTFSITGSTQTTPGGYNSTDALLIRRYLANQVVFDSLQMRAADVNNSATITSNDALLIKRRFVGLDPSFAAGNWVLQSASVTLTNQNATKNLLALSIGDVNGSFTPGLAKLTPSVTPLASGTITAEPGKPFAIPIYAGAETPLGAVTLVLELDAQNLSIQSITGLPNETMYNVIGNKLYIAWEDIKGYKPEENKPLFTIIATAKEVNTNGINFKLLPELCEVTDIEGNVLQGISISSPEIGTALPSEYRLSQNYPNPFNPSTTFEYDLPFESKVKLEIFNSLGESVEVLMAAVQVPGRYKTEWNASAMPSGVYFYRLTAESGTKNFTQVNKMILVK